MLFRYLTLSEVRKGVEEYMALRHLAQSENALTCLCRRAGAGKELRMLK